MKPSNQRILLVSERKVVQFSQVVKEKAVVTRALCCPSAKQQSGKERGVSVKGRERWKKICKIFFLGIYGFCMCPFLRSVFFTVRSHLSLPFGHSFLLSLVRDCSCIYMGGKKYPKLFFLMFVFIRWTK